MEHAKWFHRNKLDKQHNIVRNKARLVAHAYNQEKRIYFNEIFAPVAINLCMLCRFQTFLMDIKCVFLNRYIAKEIYIEQSLDFENHEFLNHLFKLKKSLYGLR